MPPTGWDHTREVRTRRRDRTCSTTTAFQCRDIGINSSSSPGFIPWRGKHKSRSEAYCEYTTGKWNKRWPSAGAQRGRGSFAGRTRWGGWRSTRRQILEHRLQWYCNHPRNVQWFSAQHQSAPSPDPTSSCATLLQASRAYRHWYHWGRWVSAKSRSTSSWDKPWSSTATSFPFASESTPRRNCRTATSSISISLHCRGKPRNVLSYQRFTSASGTQ